jgi:hypothetical protein
MRASLVVHKPPAGEFELRSGVRLTVIKSHRLVITVNDAPRRVCANDIVAGIREDGCLDIQLVAERAALGHYHLVTYLARIRVIGVIAEFRNTGFDFQVELRLLVLVGSDRRREYRNRRE